MESLTYNGINYYYFKTLEELMSFAKEEFKDLSKYNELKNNG